MSVEGMRCCVANLDDCEYPNCQQRIAELKAQSQWVSGQPPFEAKRVLVLLENNLVVIANLVDNSDSKFPYVGWQYEGMHPANIKIKGWQPLPQQPVKEKK